jgi:O-acetyl-ADP-ribose deacetylase
VAACMRGSTAPSSEWSRPPSSLAGRLGFVAGARGPVAFVVPSRQGPRSLLRGEELAQGRIELVEGDITRVEADAIVNAANESMMPGGGVDGAIQRAAGDDLLRERRTLGRCPTGEARITGAYGITTAKAIIHTVGPVWHGGERNEEALLSNCYRSSLALAAERGLSSVAFPAISTGIFGFPLQRATEIAVREVRAFLASSDAIDRVVFVCFGSAATAAYRQSLGQND